MSFNIDSIKNRVLTKDENKKLNPETGVQTTPIRLSQGFSKAIEHAEEIKAQTNKQNKSLSEQDKSLSEQNESR